MHNEVKYGGVESIFVFSAFTVQEKDKRNLSLFDLSPANVFLVLLHNF